MLHIGVILGRSGLVSARIIERVIFTLFGKALAFSEAKDLGKQLSLQLERRNWQDQCVADEAQGVVQPANVPQPLQKAVSLTLNHVLVHL